MNENLCFLISRFFQFNICIKKDIINKNKRITNTIVQRNVLRKVSPIWITTYLSLGGFVH